MLATIIVTPWFFGGVQASVQVWLFVTVLLAVVCLALVESRQAASAPIPLLVLPIAIAIGLLALQLVPLNKTSLQVLSPTAVSLHSELVSTAAASDRTLAERFGLAEPVRQTTTLDPAATRADLARLVLAAALFVLGAGFFATTQHMVWLWTALAVNGAALSLFGIVQQLTFNGKIYWTFALGQDGGPFGPFVNRNNAAGFLNLCLSGALALILFRVIRNLPRQDAHPSGLTVRPRNWLRQSKRQLTSIFAGLSAPILACGILAAVIAAGTLSSLSRGGILALAGAAGVTAVALLLVRRRIHGVGWIAAIAMIAVLMVGWIGRHASLGARLATLTESETWLTARLPHWLDGLKAVPDFWRTGSGLGTYRWVYRPYQTRCDDRWFYHAENEYLEALVETGVLGLGLMLLVLILLAVASWQVLRHGRDGAGLGFGLMAVFAFTSQVIQAGSDFGWHIPANMALSAVIGGAVAGRASRLASAGRLLRGWALPGGRRLGLAVTCLVAAACVWGLLDTRSLAAVENASNRARSALKANQPTRDRMQRAAADLTEALTSRNDDAWGHFWLGQTHERLYQVEQEAGLLSQGYSSTGPATLRELASPAMVHALAHAYARNGQTDLLNNLRGDPLVVKHLQAALRECLLARQANPLLSKVHFNLGELSVLVARPQDDQVHLDRVARLSPGDAELAKDCGLLAFQAGRMDNACASWKRSLSLSLGGLDAILAVAERQLTLQEIVGHVLPDSPPVLVELAQGRWAARQFTAMRRLLALRAEELLPRQSLADAERWYLQGAVLALKDEWPQAAAAYREAVELRPREPAWRYQLALALKHQARWSEAHEHARMAAVVEPDNVAYRTLLEELNRQILLGKS